MPQDYCTLRSVPEIFSLTNAATDSSVVRLAAPGKIIWDDGSTDDLTPGTTVIVSAYDHAVKKIDTSQATWLLMAIKGGDPQLMKEADLLLNVETVLGGANWAILRGVDSTIFPYPQV